mmetsp:Transcript_19005/g.53455  ORF Transcript_19005/g.53455 Transcript_19005/m.53455 type:complete len:250 (-) Transcript_19005:207-956(-)
MLARKESPPVNSLMRLSKNGVTSLPFTPCATLSSTARLVASSMLAASAARSSCTGTASTTPEETPNASWQCNKSAAAAGLSRRQDTGKPLFGVKKAGKSSVRKPATQTPCVSKNSSVLGRSKMLLAPAQTTHTLVRPNSVRSAEMSQDSSAPRCTPPMPPVTKMGIPARCASSIVAETVVAPLPREATTAAMSLRETFLHCKPNFPNLSNWELSMPMWTTPSNIPIVAGVTPLSRRTPSTSRAVFTFIG